MTAQFDFSGLSGPHIAVLFAGLEPIVSRLQAAGHRDAADVIVNASVALAAEAQSRADGSQAFLVTVSLPLLDSMAMNELGILERAARKSGQHPASGLFWIPLADACLEALRARKAEMN